MRAINVALCFYVLVASSAGAEWRVETVAEAGYSPGIFPQKNGDLCIIYSVPNHPGWWESRYIRKGERLQIETPAAKWGEGGPSGNNVSKCLDGDGHVHLSFYDAESAEFKYAHWTGKRWDVTALAPGNVYQTTSTIAVDPRNRVHIIYANNGVKYLCRDGDEWFSEDVDPTGFYPTVAVGDAGGVHAAYYGSSGIEVKYAYRTEEGWEAEDVCTGESYGDNLNLSLIVDKSGRSHLSFFDGCYGDLKYAVRDGSQWIVEPVDKRGWVGERSSMVLDGRGEPYILYHFEWGLRAAHKVNGDWSTVPVVDFENKDDEWNPVDFSMALDDLGRPRVIYSYSSDSSFFHHSVKLATWASTDWPEKVEEAPMVFEDESDLVSFRRWYPAALAITRDYPWRKVGGWELRAAPDSEAEVTAAIPSDKDVRIIDAVSTYGPYEDPWGQEMELYHTWLKVTSGAIEGWIPSVGFPEPGYYEPSEPPGNGDIAYTDDYESCPAVAFFAEDFAPLREGPSYEQPIIKEEQGPDNEGWFLRPEVKAGSILYVVARYGEWFCVGGGVGGAWLPAAASGLEILYPALSWAEDPDVLRFDVLFPLGDDVARVVISAGGYFKYGRYPFLDPELKVVTDYGEFDAEVEYLDGLGWYETFRVYFSATLPHPIKREDIKLVTFAFGTEPHRVGFTVDPREAWAEYEAGQ